MQISYFPMAMVAVTGSENADSHVGTFNLDFAGVGVADANVYAPFDCKVVNIYHSTNINSNTTWFQSLAPVKTPTFNDYVTFYCGHMNDADFNALGLRVGKVFKQGEKIYKAGTQGTKAAHVHMSWGRGKFVGSGWERVSSGNWRILNQVHMWEACFLRPGTVIGGESNPAGYAYKNNWKYATTPAIMENATLKAIKTTSVVVNVRELPSTFYGVVGTLPINSMIPITQISTNRVDGFQWVKVEGGYAAVVASTSIVDVLTPEQILQQKLDEANKTIATQEATIGGLKKLVAEKDAELNSFSKVASVLYEKK